MKKRPFALLEKDGTECRSGQTTRLALRYIVDAWENPGRAVRLKDHYPSMAADRMLAKVVQNMLRTLELQGFEVNHSQPSLFYTGPATFSIEAIMAPDEYRTKVEEEQGQLEEEYYGTPNRK